MEEKRMLSEEERAAIVKELMDQNKVILEEHRKKIELEFQQQLKGILTDMNQGDEYDDNDETEERSSGPHIDSTAANLANERFYEAAQDSQTAPQIHVYEGEHHTATVRASQEVTPMGEQSKPAIVSSSKSKVMNNDDGPKKVFIVKDTIPPNLQVYNQPFMRRSKSDVKKEQAEIKRRQQEKQRAAEIDEKIRSQQLINRVSSPDGYGKSEEVDALMYRVSGTTKTALTKSSTLVHDVANHNKKITKKYKIKKIVNDDECDVETDNFSPKKSSYRTQSPKRIKSSGKKTSRSNESRETKDTSFLPPVQTSTPREDEFGDTGEANKISNSNSRGSPTQDYQYVMQPDDSVRDENTGEKLPKGVFQDKRTWENQLARHILSVYATSQVEEVKKSRAVLEFIDLKSKTKSDDLVEEGIFDKSHLAAEKRKVLNASSRQVKVPVKKDATADETTASTSIDTEVPSVLKLAEKKKSTKKKKTFRVDEVDPLAKVGEVGAMTQKVLDKKERDDINTLKATEENKVTRCGLVRAPPKCFPIWFVSSGDMYAEWLALPEGDKLQSFLDGLMEKRKYLNYVETVLNLLDNDWINAYYSEAGDPVSKKKSNKLDCGQKPKKERPKTPPRRRRMMDVTELVLEEESSLSTDELRVLFRQLVLVSNAFAINCVERKDFDTAMLLIRGAEGLVRREEIFIAAIRGELKAYINQTLAYYFYRTKKSGAALNHTNLAMKTFLKVGTDADIATALLHLGCCQYQVGKFKAAHETLYRVLGMVDEGRIAFSETDPKELCLVAIAYHNLAVIQLKLQVPDVAAKSSQNARKIARLCLSYSNRWIDTFHWTHQLCLADVKFELENNFKLTEEQVAAMTELTKILYDPMPS